MLRVFYKDFYSLLFKCHDYFTGIFYSHIFVSVLCRMCMESGFILFAGFCLHRGSSVFYSGFIEWNKIPQKLKKSSSVSALSGNCKEHLLSKLSQ